LSNFQYDGGFLRPGLYASGDRVYFHGDDGLSGSELWVLAEPIAGDFNSDGGVDGADFLRWQRDLGTRPLAPGGGADGDGDDLIGGGDLDTWKAALGPMAVSSGVPLETSSAPVLRPDKAPNGAIGEMARDVALAVAEFTRLASDEFENRLLRRPRRRG
jgi:hypothetical protein